MWRCFCLLAPYLMNNFRGIVKNMLTGRGAPLLPLGGGGGGGKGCPLYGKNPLSSIWWVPLYLCWDMQITLVIVKLTSSEAQRQSHKLLRWAGWHAVVKISQTSKSFFSSGCILPSALNRLKIQSQTCFHLPFFCSFLIFIWKMSNVAKMLSKCCTLE